MNLGLTIAARPLAADFQTGVIAGRPDALTFLAKKYGKSGAVLKNGGLILFLHVGHARFGAELIDAVAADPSLKEKISFWDRGRLRPYDDVVWNLEERGIDLARKIYKDAREGSKIRILVSPPPRNTYIDAPQDIYCMTVTGEGPRGAVRLQPVLETDFRWPDAKIKSGKYQMIQTDCISLAATDDPLNQTMRIATRTPYHHAIDYAP